MINNEIVNKHLAEIKGFYHFYKDHLENNILPFWDDKVIDHEYGGYFNCYDAEGILYDKSKPGWFVGRNLYMYSSLYNDYQKQEKWLDYAKVGRDFLFKYAYAGNNDFNYLMDRQGNVIQGPVSEFTIHFAVKGLYEYIKTNNNNATANVDYSFAQKLTDNIESNMNALYSPNSDVKNDFYKHANNFMNLIVFLESHNIFGNKYSKQLDQCVKRTLYNFASDKYEAVFEYIDQSGIPRISKEGRLIDPGHTMESLWFSIEAGRLLGNEEYIRRAEKIIDWVIERGYDEEYGGFYQVVDIDKPIPEKEFQTNLYIDDPIKWNEKIWWVQAEALYTLALSAMYTGNEKHFQYFVQMHNYIKQYFIDDRYGEWFSIIDRDGSIHVSNKGSFLKGPYHIPRSVMKLTKLFHECILAINQSST
jgi:N-acylglucosamine 2-epimerase